MACGDDDDTGGSVGAGESTPTGAAEPASGEPIKVGFLNQQEGPASFPDFAAGAQVAENYINESLGGINGRPLELAECRTDGSPEASIDCANSLVEENVVAVLEGIDFGSDATLPILEEAGIPLVGHTAFGPAQSVSREAFFFGAALPAYGVAPLQVMVDDLDARTAVYIGSDTPLVHSFVDGAIAPGAEELGLELTPSYYPASNPNLSAVLATAIADDPDVVFTTASEPDCIGIVSAAQQLSYDGSVFAGSCSLFIEQAGPAAEGVYTSSDLWVPESPDLAPPDKREEIETYREQMEASEPDYVEGFAQHTFSSTMDLAAILRTVEGEPTPASVLEALRATAGLSSFMGQELTCDGRQWPGQPSACGNGILVYQVEDGQRQPVTDGFLHAEDLVAS